MTRILRGRSGFAAAGALLIVASCASPESKEASVKTSGSAIVGGALDTVHTAVVAVEGSGFACSGTIVKVSGTTGYVLTAAHCCTIASGPPTQVVLGNDYNTGQVEPVIESSVFYDASFDPIAGTGDADFCMLEFSGASGSTPVIPVAPTPDGATVGGATSVVGYGSTTAPPGGTNSKRRATTSSIEAVAASTLQMSRSPIDGGPCEGDSGGPVLLTSGTEYIVGVVSQYALTCDASFIASRVDSELGSGKFITAYLSDVPIGKHPLADGGVEEIDSDAGTGSDGGAADDGGSSSTNDGGTSSGGDGGSSGNGDGGSSSTANGATSDDGGGCATSGGNHDGSAVVIAFGLLAVLKRRKRR